MSQSALLCLTSNGEKVRFSEQTTHGMNTVTSTRLISGLAQDLTPEDKLPIGRNVLELTDIRESANYTCVALSALGVIEQTSIVKVQCENLSIWPVPPGRTCF